jgi:hypothetical protein
MPSTPKQRHDAHRRVPCFLIAIEIRSDGRVNFHQACRILGDKTG